MSLKTLLLSPVLLAQAAWVISRATRLPEPPGPRKGREGQGPALRLLILGDSSAAGVGTRHQNEALSGPLVRDLAQTYAVDWHLFAKSGATSGSTLRSLSDLPVREFDAAFISLGVNDCKNGVPRPTWRRNILELLDRLEGDYGIHQIFLSGLPPIRHFPLLPSPLNHVLGDRAARFDAVTRDIAASRTGTVFIPLDVGLDPNGMASDGFHPGPPIYAEWAAGVAQIMREHLQNPSTQ